MSFKEINPKEINENAIKLIADEWMLISCGDEKKHNMMTASWGFLGEMWGVDCAVCAIRPTRYTYELIENLDYYALCFMGKGNDCHKICGSLSGRDIDKVAKTGLTPIFDNGTMYFEEARLVLICKKLYSEDLKPENFSKNCDCIRWYDNDFHKMYYGEIVKALIK